MRRLAHGAAIDTALEAFHRRRLAEAEIYVRDSTVESIAVSAGTLEAVENKMECGAGVRVLREGRVGFAFTADLSPEGIEAMVSRAEEAASHAGADASHRLPDPEAPPDVEGNADPAVRELAAAEKAALARRVEEAARGRDRRVARTREVRYQDLSGTVSLGRAGGHRYGFAFTRAYAYIDLVAEESGESQSGFHVDFAVGPSGLDPEAIGREAAARAIHKLGGRPCPTRRASLLLAPDVVDGLLEALSPVFFAEDVLKGKSFLAGRVGQRVATERVTLIDDGRLRGGYNAAPVDGEGVASRETVLLEGGVLRAFLHDGFSARKMGEPPTGNAIRDSYLSTPSTGTSGLYLRPTGESRADLFAAVSDGLLIEEVMGLHTINPISGDFSVGAVGRGVRGGEPGQPVAGIGIAGNVRDLLGAVVGVADDLRLMATGNAASTVLLEGISVSGE